MVGMTLCSAFARGWLDLLSFVRNENCKRIENNRQGQAALVYARIVIRGAAEAAAGRGSPPPPRAGVASVWVETGSESCVFETHRETRQEREGAREVQFPSPRPPGPPRSRGMAKMRGPGCVEMMLSL